jgi:hypothetical protein
MMTKITRLPTLAVLGLALAVWIVGASIIAQTSSIGYWLFTMWEIFSPTLITIFLYARSVIRESSRRVRWRLHIAWLATLAVVLLLLVEASRGHQAARDVADVWWTIYHFSTLIVGPVCFWISFGLAYPFTTDPKPREPVAAGQPATRPLSK